jgi:hypothetical protein
MDTYRVDVKSILDVLGESIEVSDALPLVNLEVGDEYFGLREPIRFQVTLTNGGTGVVGHRLRNRRDDGDLRALPHRVPAHHRGGRRGLLREAGRH